jgi:hypothetical protein
MAMDNPWALLAGGAALLFVDFCTAFNSGVSAGVPRRTPARAAGEAVIISSDFTGPSYIGCPRPPRTTRGYSSTPETRANPNAGLGSETDVGPLVPAQRQLSQVAARACATPKAGPPDD